jgi:GxxExxY protein
MAKALIAVHAKSIWKTLGPGFSERVYHNAMELCLRKSSIPYETERIMPIFFEDAAIGNLRADIIVDQKLVVELKSVRALKDEHRIQARQYLRLLGLDEAMLINFPTFDTLHPEIEEITLSLSLPNATLCK